MIFILNGVHIAVSWSILDRPLYCLSFNLWPLWYIQTSTKFCSKFLSPAMFYVIEPIALIWKLQGPLWSRSYGSWIYNYPWNQCLSPLTLWVWIPHRRGLIYTPLCDKVCQWLTVGLWFSLGTLVSSTNKTDRHDITEILLKVALNTIN